MSSLSSSAPQQAESAAHDCTCQNCVANGNEQGKVWYNREILIRNPEDIRGPRIRNLEVGDSTGLVGAASLNDILEQVLEVGPNSSIPNGSDGSNVVSDECEIVLPNESSSGEIDEDGSELLYTIEVVPTIEDLINASLASQISQSAPPGLQWQLHFFDAESSNDQLVNDGNGNEDSEESIGIFLRPTAYDDANLESGRPNKNTSVPAGEAKEGGETLNQTDEIQKWQGSTSTTPDEKEQLSEKNELEQRVRTSAQTTNQVEEFELHQDVENNDYDGGAEEVLSRSRTLQTREAAKPFRESPSSSAGGCGKMKNVTHAEQQERRVRDAKRKRLARKRDRQNGTVKIVGRKKLVSQMTSEEHEAIKTKWRVDARDRRARQRDTMTPEDREKYLRQQRERRRIKRGMMTQEQKLEEKLRNSEQRRQKRMKITKDENQSQRTNYQCKNCGGQDASDTHGFNENAGLV